MRLDAETAKPSPAELALPFLLRAQQTEDNLTSFGGMPLLVHAFRSLGAGPSANRNLAWKQRQQRLDEASYVRRRTTDWIATIDLDAMIIESWKREPQPTGDAGAVGGERDRRV